MAEKEFNAYSHQASIQNRHVNLINKTNFLIKLRFQIKTLKDQIITIKLGKSYKIKIFLLVCRTTFSKISMALMKCLRYRVIEIKIRKLIKRNKILLKWVSRMKDTNISKSSSKVKWNHLNKNSLRSNKLPLVHQAW